MPVADSGPDGATPKSVDRPAGWDKQYRAQIDQLDQLIQPLLHDRFFFVNIGASDGVHDDPIFPFIQRYGWSGLAIEPSPTAFAWLRSNYALFENVQCVNVAVSNVPRRFWYVEEGSGLSEWAVRQIGSFDRNQVLEAISFLCVAVGAAEASPTGSPTASTASTPNVQASEVENYVRSLEIDCVPFNALMRQHSVEHIDFLNIDTEGSDYEILRSIDFERYAPQVMCLETSTSSGEDRKSIAGLLTNFGYKSEMRFGPWSGIYIR